MKYQIVNNLPAAPRGTISELYQSKSTLALPAIKQDYSAYTPADHTTWSTLYHACKDKLHGVAHPGFLAGLIEFGIGGEFIPHLDQIDAALERVGWRTLAVDGFIHPRLFMEALAQRQLPIAVAMRKSEELHYSPRPDIFHELFGHAPFLFIPEYRDFIQKIGALASRLAMSMEEWTYYQAITDQCNHGGDHTSAEVAEKRPGRDAPFQQLTRFFWWTIETGSLRADRKLVGAAVVSSAGEIDNFLATKDIVPMSMENFHLNFDPTELQKSYFSFESFAELETLLDCKIALLQGSSIQ